jgi:hypothetical protein
MIAALTIVGLLLCWALLGIDNGRGTGRLE